MSFAGNSAILRCSCYKEATFYLTINVFWNQQHIVQRKSFLYAFSSNSQKLERFPAKRKRFIPHKYVLRGQAIHALVESMNKQKQIKTIDNKTHQ